MEHFNVLEYAVNWFIEVDDDIDLNDYVINYCDDKDDDDVEDDADDVDADDGSDEEPIISADVTEYYTLLEQRKSKVIHFRRFSHTINIYISLNIGMISLYQLI